QCTVTIHNLINTATLNMTNTAKNINTQVKTFKETTQLDLKTKMDQISKTVALTLNNPVLSKYAGYDAKKNIYTFDQKGRDKEQFYSEYPELEKPPLNLKVLNPENILDQFEENVEAIKSRYADMVK